MNNNIFWFLIENNVYIHGYDYQYIYVLNNLNIVRKWDKYIDNSLVIKLTKKEVKEIKKTNFIIFNSLENAILFFDRQKKLNELEND